MADIDTTFGFVFSVEDQTSPTLERAAAAAETTSDQIEGFLGGVVESAESIVGALGPIAADVEEQLGALGGASTDLVNSMVEGFGEFDELEGLALIEYAEGLLNQIREGEAMEAADALSDLAESFNNLGDAMLSQGGLDAILEGFNEAAEEFLTDLDEMEEAIGEGGPGDAGGGGSGFLGALGGVWSSLLTGLDYIAMFGGGLNNLGDQLIATGGAGGRFGGNLLKGFGNLFGGGGLMGYLLGPIGPILQMLSPLISLLVDTLLPIFQDFMAIIQNAFAPLQFVLDTLLQSLIPDIQKLMAPIVAMLTYVAVDLGTQLQQMFAGIAGFIGPAMKAIVGLMPVLQEVFGSIVKVAIKALPMLIKLLNEVVPIFVELAKILAEAFIVRMDIIAEMIEELGPDFITLIVELLKATLPLTKAFIELGNVLLSEVFAPILIPFLKATAKALTVLAILTGALLQPIVALFSYITDALAELHDNWNKFLVAFPEIGQFFTDAKAVLSDFQDWVVEWLSDMFAAIMHWWSGSGVKEDILEPMLEWIPAQFTKLGTWIRAKVDGLLDFILGLPRKIMDSVLGFGKWLVTQWAKGAKWLLGLGEKILTALGLKGVVEDAKGVLQAAISALEAPLKAMKEWVNYYIIDSINEILAAQLPVIGVSLGDITGALYGYSSLPRLAAGGVATGEEGVTAEVGEAGTAEAIVPLNERNLARFMEPALGNLVIPGLDEQNDYLSELVDMGRAALRLMERAEDDREQGSASGDHDVESDLRGSIGLGGMIPVGG